MSARSSLNFPNNLTQVPISILASGPATLVPGTPGKTTKVFRMKLIWSAATNITFFDENTMIDNLIFPGAGAMVLDFTTIDMPPWYETSPGNDLVIVNSGLAGLSGNLDYLQS